MPAGSIVNAHRHSSTADEHQVPCQPNSSLSIPSTHICRQAQVNHSECEAQRQSWQVGSRHRQGGGGIACLNSLCDYTHKVAARSGCFTNAGGTISTCHRVPYLRSSATLPTNSIRPRPSWPVQDYAAGNATLAASRLGMIQRLTTLQKVAEERIAALEQQLNTTRAELNTTRTAMSEAKSDLDSTIEDMKQLQADLEASRLQVGSAGPSRLLGDAWHPAGRVFCHPEQHSRALLHLDNPWPCLPGTNGACPLHQHRHGLAHVTRTAEPRPLAAPAAAGGRHGECVV